MDKRGQFTFYRSYYEALLSLPKIEREPVLMAIISYALDGEAPNLQGVGNAIFSLVKPTLDTGRKRAESGNKGGKQNGSKTEANAKQTASEKEKEKEGEKEREKEKENECSISPPCMSPPSPGGTHTAPKKFTPPTVEEVREYCRERNNGVDPQKFHDFYASKGWKVGNQPMKDWKAAVRTWERDDRPARSNAGQKSKMPGMPAPMQGGGDVDKLARILGVKE